MMIRFIKLLAIQMFAAGILALEFPTFAIAQREDAVRVIVTTAKSRNPIVKRSVVDATTLNVIVRDEIGDPIGGLQRGNFQVKRGKKEGEVLSVKENVKAREVGRRIALLIDNSSSMSPRVRNVLEDLDSLLAGFGKNTAVAILLFDREKGTLFEYEGKMLPIKGKWFTTNSLQLTPYLHKEFVSGNLINSTSLYDEVYAGYKLLEASRLRSSTDAAIVLSDGEDNASIVDEDSVLALKWGATPFYTIDYLTGKQNPFLRRLAAKSGGKYYQAGQISDLRQVFATITEEIITGGYELKIRFKEDPKGAVTFYAQSLDIADSTSVRSTVDTLVIEEQIVRQQFPLLTYVFFDSASVDISARYQLLQSPQQTTYFDEFSVSGGALEHYYHILNILGKRLRSIPDATITLVGCGDNSPGEISVGSIGQKRAETTRNYLTSIWEIDPNRIQVTGRMLPELQSTTTITEGQQENRRVEIVSSEWEIIKPIVFSLREAVASPPETRFALEVYAGEGVQSWTLAVYAGSQLWREFHGTQGPFINLAWDWKDSAHNLPRSSLRYQFIVRDSADVANVVHSRTIPVRALTIERKEVEHLPEKDVEKINLILFDFGSAVLGWRNEKILQTIRDRVTPQASVLVAGFTDVIGEDTFNEALSEQRASSVRGKLSGIVRTSRPITTRGYGETSPLFTNLLPEGRFYNRTVQIVVETPVKKE